MLLGIWLVILGRGLRRTLGERRWWALTALGGWTVAVAAAKLAQPTLAAEDWLGFLLAVGYLGLGAGLLRRRPGGPGRGGAPGDGGSAPVPGRGSDRPRRPVDDGV